MPLHEDNLQSKFASEPVFVYVDQPRHLRTGVRNRLYLHLTSQLLLCLLYCTNPHLEVLLPVFPFPHIRCWPLSSCAARARLKNAFLLFYILPQTDPDWSELQTEILMYSLPICMSKNVPFPTDAYGIFCFRQRPGYIQKNYFPVPCPEPLGTEKGIFFTLSGYIQKNCRSRSTFLPSAGY